MYNKNDSILIISKSGGYLAPLGMCGPIFNPINVPLPICYQLVVAGAEIYEYEANTGRLAKITVQNVYDDNKFTGPEIPKSTQQSTLIPTPIPPASNKNDITRVEIDENINVSIDMMPTPKNPPIVENSLILTPVNDIINTDPQKEEVSAKTVTTTTVKSGKKRSNKR